MSRVGGESMFSRRGFMLWTERGRSMSRGTCSSSGRDGFFGNSLTGVKGLRRTGSCSGRDGFFGNCLGRTIGWTIVTASIDRLTERDGAFGFVVIRLCRMLCVGYKVVCRMFR